MKNICYYGSEIDKERTKSLGFPCYTLGLFCHTLQPYETENEVRREIEARCKKNVANMQFCDTLTGRPIKNFKSFYFIEKEF